MKVFITILAIICVVAAAPSGPISLSNNNVGDIVSVGVNANAVVSSNVEANVANILAALMNQQAVVLDGDLSSLPLEPLSDAASSNATPDLISKLKSFKITPEVIDNFKNMINGVEKIE
jgi:hypothetical protein